MTNSSKEPRQIEAFPVWTYQQAVLAVPYFASVMRSIRELFLEMRSLRVRAERLADKSRQSMIERDDALREADRLQIQLADAARELAQLNVHCVDAPGGIAMIPCVHRDHLAWMVFELFDPAGITSWRYHQDPLYARRPLVGQ